MTFPVVVLAGVGEPLPDWAQQLADSLAETYTFRTRRERTGYVSALADDLAALVLVDGDADDWRFWTATVKSSPATRRIPVLLVSDDDSRRAQALGSGADIAQTPAELRQNPARTLADYARVHDPARAERLACECQQPLPPLAVQGIEQFNQGEFYKQHDSFEELWMETEGPVRDLYRAVLQVGVAYYQILRGNHRGARKMLLRSVQWLAVLPDTCQGIDVAALRDDSYRVRAELERLPEDAIDQFDRSLLQPVRLVDAQAD